MFWSHTALRAAGRTEGKSNGFETTPPKYYGQILGPSSGAGGRVHHCHCDTRNVWALADTKGERNVRTAFLGRHFFFPRVFHCGSISTGKTFNEVYLKRSSAQGKLEPVGDNGAAHVAEARSLARAARRDAGMMRGTGGIQPDFWVPDRAGNRRVSFKKPPTCKAYSFDKEP